MSRLYEMMFVIDNNAVRAGWSEAKATVTGLIEKHGGSVKTARRWGERRLAYPIRHRRRGTYLLSYGEIDPAEVAGLRRELDLSETVLRYLVLQAGEIPADELALTQAEAEAGFEVPEPPADDALDVEVDGSSEEGENDGGDGDDDSSDDSGDDQDDDERSEKSEKKKED
jgi:small subunit ribosomal protein S6